MYLCNHVKLALLIEGNTDPTQKEIEDAVTATSYSGYVSLEYEKQKSAALRKLATTTTTASAKAAPTKKKAAK